MKTIIITVLPLLLIGKIYAQEADRAIVVFIDSLTRLPIPGMTVIAQPGNGRYVTDDAGRLKIGAMSKTLNTISTYSIGYRRRSFSADILKSSLYLYLVPERTELKEVTIVSASSNANRSISQSDISFRGVSNSQEVLRMVPGLFIAQHQGGGKAEQIFLRGFDNDHGKDIALSMDGMPINMVSHAHGQGYADSHFIIPETIGEVDYKKGMFDADKGDLAVSGWVNYRSKDAIDNQLKVEAGQFSTFRATLIFNMLSQKAKERGQHLYIASEYRYSDAYFKDPQHFKRANFFVKYLGKLGGKNQLSLTASAFSSTWDASGQISLEDVREGMVEYFGSVDPHEGGRTSRYNLNLAVLSATGKNSLLKNQVYYTRYNFDLTSNFTFFLNDQTNGDEIRQQESRNLMGYNSAYKFSVNVGQGEVNTEIGLNSRFDFTDNTSLSHTIDRYTLLTPLKLGDISEYSAGLYFSGTLKINEKLRMNLGARYDRFFYRYENKLPQDSAFQGAGKYKATNGSFSPKLNIYYTLNSTAQLFLSMGKGFNTNDVRSVVAQSRPGGIPSAYGADLGIILKASAKIIVSSTLWYSYLQQEFVYGGDGGTIDFSGRTQRLGADLALRFQPLTAVYLDVDINLARGKSLDDEHGKDYIPLAPRLSSTGGITYLTKRGISGSIRYRYVSKRPANEDYSLIADGYLVNDLVLAYSKKRYGIGININNLFNVRWKESQFVEETRLQGMQPREGITFTPGTRFYASCQLTYNFK
ncbi:TonB-dependent receptor [Pedobacter panaciterrae]|uniref:TonB-dependent receptor n=1 Tax=Pedobacter panaciterrae TaxID=363849 RepID=UPI002595E93A|nr:TonB-dependent receptor [uncultured Pedobacter sp.]